MRTFIVLQTTVPDYRLPFFHTLSSRLNGLAEMRVLAGEEYFAASVKTRVDGATWFGLVRNLYLLRRSLLIQGLPWPKLIRAPFVVLELNPRIITNWGILIFAYLARRKCVVWGHAWSRSGACDWTALPRLCMMSLASGVVVYTRLQVRELATSWGVRALAACNSTFSRGFVPRFDPTKRADYIYVGRLVREKRVDFLISEFIAYKRAGGSGRLHVIGEGPLEAELRWSVSQAEFVGDGICFYGHISDAHLLEPIYGQCRFSVSPGYVGLSVIQSFYMGVPMIVSQFEPHAPEIEACVHGGNSIVAPLADEGYLARLLKDIDAGTVVVTWNNSAIAEYARKRYSVESMAEAIVEASELDVAGADRVI